MLTPDELMKVADIEARIAIPIQRQQAVHLGHRRPFGGRRAAAPVKEPS